MRSTRWCNLASQILVGDNPFIGVSHLSSGKGVDEERAATNDQMERVLKAALEAGANGFTFTTHPKILDLFRHLSEGGSADVLDRLDYYVLTPYAYEYVRQANLRGTVDLAWSILRRMGVSGVGSMLLDMDTIPSHFIRSELAPFLEILPKKRVKAVLLHEILTEPIIAFGSWNILRKLRHDVSRETGTSFGIETRNLGYLDSCMRDVSTAADYVMTPLNPLGYQMAPSKGACENVVSALGKHVKIIAMNTLASGASTLQESADYLASMKRSLYAVATASVNPNRIRGNVRALAEALRESVPDARPEQG